MRSFNECCLPVMSAGYSGIDFAKTVCISLPLCCLLLTCAGPCMRIAPVDVPQYPGLPLEWEDFDK